MSYLERRRNLWYAVLTIPEDARDALGKIRFVQSLGTPDKRKADQEKLPLIAKWKAMIAEARGEKDALTERGETLAASSFNAGNIGQIRRKPVRYRP